MISKFITLPLFIAAGAVARPALLRRDPNIPSLSQWSQSNLESYWTFKTRYTSLDCASQQGSDFYNSCCNPLAAGQTTADLPSECTPASLVCVGVNPFAASATSSSAPADTPAATDNGTNNVDYSDNAYTPPADTYTPPADTYTPPADTSPAASPSPDNSSNTGGNEIGDAFATYYYQGGNAGACGDFHGDYDYIGAIDVAWYGDMGQKSQYCGRSVTVTNQNNGRQVTIIVADVCPTCNTNNSFDLSVGAFQAIADLGDGLVPITWHFN